MTHGMPTRLTAACLGMSAFALAVLAGLAADNPVDVILMRAIIASLVCHMLGWAIGAVAERAVNDRVEQYVREHPAEPPQVGDDGPGPDAAAGGREESFAH